MIARYLVHETCSLLQAMQAEMLFFFAIFWQKGELNSYINKNAFACGGVDINDLHLHWDDVTLLGFNSFLFRSPTKSRL